MDDDYIRLSEYKNGVYKFQNIDTIAVRVDAEKTWRLNYEDEMSSVLPESYRPAGVELTLYHKTNAVTDTSILVNGNTYDIVKFDAVGRKITNPRLVRSKESWTGVFELLSGTVDNDGVTPEEYLVKETAIYIGGTGKSNRIADFENYFIAEGGFAKNAGASEVPENGDVIELELNNRLATVGIAVTKEWTGKFIDIPNKTAEFTVYRNGTVYRDFNGHLVKLTLPTAGGSWTSTISGLPKNDEHGNPITWSVAESKVTFEEDESVTELIGNDISTYFSFVATSNGETVPVEQGRADVTFVSNVGDLTYRNVVNETKTVKLKKQWTDAAYTSHDSDTIYFDLYRTVEDYTQSKIRKTIPVFGMNDSNDTEFTMLTNKITVGNNDILQVKVASRKIESNGTYRYDLVGLYKNTHYKDEDAYKPTGIVNQDGNQPVSDNDRPAMFGYSSWGTTDTEIYIKYKISDISGITQFFVRNWTGAEITVTNLTLEEELANEGRVTRDALLRFIDKGYASLVKSNVPFKKTSTPGEEWTYTAELPKYTPDGTAEYNYFVVEYPVDGYKDSYKKEDGDEFTIKNSLPDNEVTSFTFHKLWLDADTLKNEMLNWKQPINVELFDGDESIGVYRLELVSDRVRAVNVTGNSYDIVSGKTGCDYYFTINDLPKGGNYSIKEIASHNTECDIYYGKMVGKNINVDLDADSATAAHPYIINRLIPSHEMPSVGGEGRYAIMCLGALLSAFAICLILKKRVRSKT